MSASDRITRVVALWPAAFALAAFFATGSAAIFAASAPLPKATQDDLKKLKLDPSILSDLDKELTVPQSWIDGAKKERKLRIFSTFDPPQAEIVFRAFKERYPFIAIEYNRASHEDRAIRTLIAYKNKKSITDILTGLGGSFFMYREIGAMEDLRNIPTLKNNPPGTFDPEGFWVGMHMRYWCMAYNTKQISKADVPKKWEDFLTNPKWRNGNLALGNRPQLWALQLWKAKGEKWTKDFLIKLFSETKPQLRREGMNAMLELLAAGEFYGSIPSAEYRTYQKTLDGAPVSYTCPEPVPVAVSEMAILKGAPNINAARLFVNWFLSKEGQIAQYVADYAPPVHKGLQRRELLPFADQIVGKEDSFRDPALELEVQPKLLEFWDELWLKGGGKRRGRS
ncbi:MAG TPA: extracellular solute-binding protein [Candidatus Udaeobacter sp.]|nr:extracellular solute-binding protein [Candidatus Udaeobacter sp.]